MFVNVNFLWRFSVHGVAVCGGGVTVLVVFLVLFSHFLLNILSGDGSADWLAVEVNGDEKEEEVDDDVEQQPPVLEWVVGLALSWAVENGLHVDQNCDLVEEETNNANATAEDSVQASHAANLFDNVDGVHADQ